MVFSNMDISHEISKVSFWHQQIDLGNGYLTPGAQDTASLLRQIRLPDDLSGMRVLDLGARDGYFSFECERRGASEVVALDYVPADQTGFEICKKILNSNVNYINNNVYSIDKSSLGDFDLVLCLGLIYHLRHPVLAIDRIYDVLKKDGTLILETHVIDGGLVDQENQWISLSSIDPHLSEMQMAQFYAGGKLNNDISNFWAPSLSCLEGIVSNSGFSINTSWVESFRGGLSATKVPLESNHPRFIDTAKSIEQPHHGWDINKIISVGEI
jgi:tRNA (mo5U34)-methyltransferase